MTEGHDHDHDHHAHDRTELGVGLLTVSSSRTLAEDTAGDTAAHAAEAAGHRVRTRELLPDDSAAIREQVRAFVEDEEIDLVVTMGGTGITPDDVTPEAVRALFDRDLPGFGERFRARSVEQIGERVIATRAIAGVANGVPIFCVPGSEPAVELAVEELILEVAGHLVGLANR